MNQLQPWSPMLSIGALAGGDAGRCWRPAGPRAHAKRGRTIDAATVCTPGYAKSVRHVSGKVKAQVYAEYGIVSHRPGEYEVDHLISLELGGSDDIKNLWPDRFRCCCSRQSARAS